MAVLLDICSVQYLLLYLWPKFLKNTFELVHTQYWSFSKKNNIHIENLLNGYYNYFTLNFSKRYFSELLFLVGDRKINKIYQLKLKPGDRLWVLEITLGNYVFMANYFV